MGGSLLYRMRHWLNRNTREGSQKEHSRALRPGNAFYELWLDDTMNYSSAWFEGDRSRPMQDAQHAGAGPWQNSLIVQPGARVLRSSWWLEVRLMATTEFGARLTGVTLSTEQLAFARDRMQRIGCAGCRTQPAGLSRHRGPDSGAGAYDAVRCPSRWPRPGRNFWPTYFDRGGRARPAAARIQSIVIDDALFDR